MYTCADTYTHTYTLYVIPTHIYTFSHMNAHIHTPHSHICNAHIYTTKKKRNFWPLNPFLVHKCGQRRESTWLRSHRQEVQFGLSVARPLWAQTAGPSTPSWGFPFKIHCLLWNCIFRFKKKISPEEVWSFEERKATHCCMLGRLEEEVLLSVGEVFSFSILFSVFPSVFWLRGKAEPSSAPRE